MKSNHMRHKIFLFFLVAGLSIHSMGQQPEKKPLRIVDTMTQQEKSARNPVILRSELDSLIKAYTPAQTVQQVQESGKTETNLISPAIWAALGGIALLLTWLLSQFYTYKRKFNRVIVIFGRQMRALSSEGGNPGIMSKVSNDMAREKSSKTKASPPSLETRISELSDELHKLKKENEGLNRVIKEYNGIQHEYDSLRHGLTKAYKVRNYPGYEKGKPENSLLQGVLETESTVANYAYERFLKPIFSI